MRNARSKIGTGEWLNAVLAFGQVAGLALGKRAWLAGLAAWYRLGFGFKTGVFSISGLCRTAFSLTLRLFDLQHHITSEATFFVSRKELWKLNLVISCEEVSGEAAAAGSVAECRG